MRIPSLTNQDDSWKVSGTFFFFRGSRGWKAVSQILSVGGVAHVQPRLGKLRFRWSKQDIFEHWKNCRDGVSNQENPKLVGTIICSKQKPGGVFFLYWIAIKRNTIYHTETTKKTHTVGRWRFVWGPFAPSWCWMWKGRLVWLVTPRCWGEDLLVT